MIAKKAYLTLALTLFPSMAILGVEGENDLDDETGTSDQSASVVIDTDGDGLSDYMEVYRRGTNPNNSPEWDTDSDGIKDYDDAVGYDEKLSFKAAPEAAYAVIDLGELSGGIVAVNNKGTVVLQRSFQESGETVYEFSRLKLGQAAENVTGRFCDLNNNDEAAYYLDPADTEIKVKSASGSVSSVDLSSHLGMNGHQTYSFLPYGGEPPTYASGAIETGESAYAGINFGSVLIEDDGDVWANIEGGFDWTETIYRNILTEQPGEDLEVHETNEHGSFSIDDLNHYEYEFWATTENGGRVSGFSRLRYFDDSNESFGPVPGTITIESLNNASLPGLDGLKRIAQHRHDGSFAHAYQDEDKLQFSDSIIENPNASLSTIGVIGDQNELWKVWNDSTLSKDKHDTGSDIYNLKQQGEPLDVMFIAKNGLLRVGGGLWRNGRLLTDGEILGGNSGWTNLSIGAISDSGAFIAGTAKNSEGETHKVVLMQIVVEWISKDNDPEEENYNPVEDYFVPASYGDYTSKDLKWLNGKRYFSGGATPSAKANRTRLNVKVTLPGLSGKTVNIKAFDVDDPTPHEWDPEGIIDDNDTETYKVGNDNFNTSGLFTTSSKVLDADGSATFEFVSSSKPGSNFRVAATLSEFATSLNELQVANSSNDHYVSPDDEAVSGFIGGLSPTLTIWRRLHVEFDSMRSIESSTEENSEAGYISSGPYSETTGMFAKITFNLADGVDGGNRYEYGNFRAMIYSPVIQSNSSSSVTVFNKYNESEPDEMVGAPYLILDDDDKLLSDHGLPYPLPYLGDLENIINSMNAKYAPAYIETEEINSKGLNPDQFVDFKLNEISGASIYPTVFDDAINLPKSEFYWGWTIVFGYQYKESEDADPNNEETYVGSTPEDSNFIYADIYHGYSVIYMEAIRDIAFAGLIDLKYNNPTIYQGELEEQTKDYKHLIYGTIAHEIGHPPESGGESGDHDEGGLMQEGGGPITLDFEAESIKRFRSALLWNDT